MSRPVMELYLDESGSREVDHKPGKTASLQDYFAVGGILIEARHTRAVWDSHRRFCDSWKINYPLHSHEIRNRRQHFFWLRNKEIRERFLDGLRSLMLDIPCVAMACVIDRPGYNARYKSVYGSARWKLCKTAFAIMIECSAKFADRRGFTLTIHYEGVAAKENAQTENYAKELKRSGMPFELNNSVKYAPLVAADFSRIILGDPRRVTKDVPLCQIADLVLHPIAVAGYAPSHEPYVWLKSNGKLMDCVLATADVPYLGIKYSCFEKTKDPVV